MGMMRIRDELKQKRQTFCNGLIFKMRNEVGDAETRHSVAANSNCKINLTRLAYNGGWGGNVYKTISR